jgi:peptidoglycan/xylan/chitin deacetylase (PgdA/CDA1 family)
MNSHGIFLISLDFELHWGSSDKLKLSDSVKRKLLQTREVIPNLLQLFDAYKIHATWATVGMIFNNSLDDWKQNLQLYNSIYKNSNVVKKIIDQLELDNSSNYDFYFAPSLIKDIHDTPYQEIGSHTYSHFCYFDRKSNNDEFKIDLLTAIDIAKKSNLSLESLVFPRNQYSSDSISICKEIGFKNVRTNPNVWYWNLIKGDTILKKVFRTLDNFNVFDLSKIHKLSELVALENNSIILLPASRIFKPWKKHYYILNNLKVKRIKLEMTKAAKSKSYYHLWWHPENFGNNPSECMAELKEILEHYDFLNKKFGFRSYNMSEVASAILNK